MASSRSTVTFSRELQRVVRTTPARNRQEVRGHLDQLVANGVTSFGKPFRVAQSGKGNHALRATSRWAIGRLTPKGWIRVLGKALATDADPEVTHQAVEALTASGHAMAVKAIKDALLRGKHPINRATAAWGLGSLHSPSAVPGLIAALRRKKEDPTVKAEAAEALGYIRNRAAVGPLIALLNDPNPSVRFQAVFGLGTLGDPRALPALEKLRDDNTEAGGWGRSVRPWSLRRTISRW